MLKNIFILILICLLPSFAQAASGAGAINMTFNPSARAAGMGDTGVAIPWGGDTNHWANPAMLAFRSGIHYRSFESQLAAGLADDIFITNEELTIGAYGVTFLLAKGPMDGNYLDMGMQTGVDENGQLIGEFNSFMKSETIGVGVDGVELMANLMGKENFSLARYFSVAVGAAWHEFEDRLAPDSVLQDDGGGSAEGTCMSMGYVASVTPIDFSEGAGFMINGAFGLKLSGAYGASVLNKTDDFIVHVDADQADPFPRAHLSGWGVNAQLTLADDLRTKLNDASFGILGDICNPLLSLTYGKQLNEPGYDWQDNHYVYAGKWAS